MVEPVDQAIYRGLKFDAAHYVPWAKAFDADGIKWEYRPQVHEEGGYLVDFLLPDVPMFIVVWSTTFFFEEVAPCVYALVRESGRPAFITVGPPGEEISMLIERSGRRVKKRWCRWALVVGELRAAGTLLTD